ncbi:MAG: RHS repeat-associated core domain-containing protein [Gemmatimonadota bacterium]
MRDSIDMDTTGAPIVTNFRPYESVGWAPSSVDTALTYGLIDGPRTDVGDTTLFWLDQFQEPRRIRNALGQETSLSRANATYPALVTRMQAPNGRVVLATYDGHGNIATSTDSGTCISGTCATTTYLWDQKWDFVRKVTAPLGEVSLSSYDQAFGNKDWQSIDADSTIQTHRVSFTYDATWHFTSTVQEPLIAGQQRIWYNGAGNLDSVKSPTNIPTRFYSDSLGRDTLVKSAIDYGDTTWVMSTTTYNVSDQDILSKSYSYPLSLDLGTTIHGKLFDPEENVLRDSVIASPDTNHIGWVKHVWAYDRANRKRTEYPQGPVYGHETFTYDAAGNVVSWLPRAGNSNTTTYDVLNRPTRRVVPSLGIGGLDRYTYGSSFLADTLTFTYDIAGNTLTANNVFAKISRAYYLNGSLAADTERVRESDSASTAFSHLYGTRYGYDLEGRRSWLKHPATLASAGTDSVAYAYDALTGMLKSVRDPYGNRFGFSYDAALRLSSDTAAMTTGAVLLQTRSYDNESRMVGHRETQNGSTIIQDSLFYDARNKQTSATFLTGSETNTYSKIGALAQHVSPTSNDTVITDALGHQRSHATQLQGYTASTMLYDAAGSAELVTVAGARPGGMKDTTGNTYDLAGSLWNATNRREIAASGIGHVVPYFARTRTWSRYGSNLQLMAVETRFDTVDATIVYGPTTYYEREEYRYDAVGRRIWRRLIRPTGLCSKMDFASGCLSVVERTVWDGDQVLWDIRSDGGEGASSVAMEVDASGVRTTPALEGRVFYTHGPGIDHPLSIGRLDANVTAIVPEYDWKGNAIAGYCTAGTLCTQLQWPEKLESPWDQDPPPAGGPTVWAGNLIDNHKDGSGFVYMRNRYYDPSSGRFTQTDPIGLAGGLNAYGFVGGDPVNYSDPFGLFPLGKIIKLGVEGFQVLMKGVREERLIAAVKEGEDVIAPTQTAARRIARAAGDGKTPVGPESHTLAGGSEGRSHYHVNGRAGPSHIFYGIAAALTLSHYAENSSPVVKGAAEIGDFFNPLSLPSDAIGIYTTIRDMTSGSNSSGAKP